LSAAAALGLAALDSAGATASEQDAGRLPMSSGCTLAEAAATIDASPAGEISGISAMLRRCPRGDVASLLEARLAALRLDYPAVKANAAKTPRDAGTPSAARIDALLSLSDSAFAVGQYRDAVGALEQLRPLYIAAGRSSELSDADQTLSIARVLVGQPIQRVVHLVPGRVASARDTVGLLRSDVTINGMTQSAVLDTGANLSVVTQTTAKRLGLRILDGTGSVGASAAQDVATEIGVADRLQVGGTVLKNVAFLVLADDKLKLPVPGGYQIDAIIGFPVFRAVGRVEFSTKGWMDIGAPTRAGAAPRNLRAIGSDLYVVVTIDGEEVPLHLDTGASDTALSSLFAVTHPVAIKEARVIEQRTAGAGGAKVGREALIAKACLGLGAERLGVHDLHVGMESEKASSKKLGTLGQDVLKRFESFSIDFRNMSFEVEKPASGNITPCA
jgi:predicted aspartyl protease